jgi:23S rRNA pseudouridine1911/1915/1917 synthase
MRRTDHRPGTVGEQYRHAVGEHHGAHGAFPSSLARIRMAVRDDGRDAVTHYRLSERFRAHTALECRLETGRTHQIRVHMAHLKHPIVGDPLYGGALKLPRGATPDLIEALRGFRRQALHAQTLEFIHPASGEALRCTAPVPADMQRLLQVLREDARAAQAAAR